MLIRFCGDEAKIPEGFSIQQLMQLKNMLDDVVVVLNGDIIGVEFWSSTLLHPNDEVELIQFMDGG